MSAAELFIRDLVIQAIVGVHPHERITPQPIALDISFQVDISAAATSDDLIDAIDYSAIAVGLTAFVESTRYQLIEALAEAILAWLWAFSAAISHVTLELRKPQAIPQAQTVGLRLRRSRPLADVAEVYV